MKRLRYCLVFLALASCGAPSSAVNASNDIDCALVNGYFVRLNKILHRSPREQRVVEILFKWYFEQANGGGKLNPSKFTDERVKLIDDFVVNDISAGAKLFQACAKRAMEQPEFIAFAKPKGW